jgi:hypothetical protein
MKRQRGRNRGGGGGGGNKPQNANRAFDSNGPDGVKVRGNAQHVFEKYQQLARDAGSAGDRVLAENYLQHAEHYFRLLRALQPQRPAAEILGRDQFASGYDIDFEDEGAQAQAEAADEAGEVQAEAREGGERRDDRNRDRDRDRDNRDRDNRDRGDRSDRGEWQGRDRDRERDGERRDGEGRQGRRDRWRDRRDRDDRPRAEGEERREGEGRRDRDDRRERSDRGDRPERDPMPVIEPQGDVRADSPRAEAREERGAVLRDAEGGESHAPAFLQARAEPRPEAAEGEERPARRRRRPRSFEAGEAPGGETEEA